jgi:tetratricopeptide (TPR) repeat protein
MTRRTTETTGPLARAVGYGLALLLVAAPLAVGGTRWGVQLLLAGAALLLLALGAWGRLANGGFRVPWPVWGPIALVGLGLLQLVPLPPSVLAVLSPRAHQVLTYSLGDLGLYDAQHWHALSLDPPSTWVATFHQAAFAAVALLAANAGRRDGRLIERALSTGAGLVALIGFAHWGFGLHRIYGVYEAHDIARLNGWFTTFVNPNTAAGYLVLGALVSLGLFAGTGDPRLRPLAAASLVLATAGCFLTGSRGGHVALLAGFVVFAALAHAPVKEDDGDEARGRARTASRVALGVGLLGVVLALALLPDWQHTHWDDPGAEQKVNAWWATKGYIADFWATGSGRGTFGLVYPQYQSILIRGTVTHPENVVLQLITEWGLIGGLVGLASGVLAWFVALGAVGRAAHPAHWGLVAGLGAVGLQQLVDFGFEAAGLSLPVAAGLGLALGRAARRPGQRTGARRPVWAWTAAVVALALVSLLAWRGRSAAGGHPDVALAAVRAADATPDAILDEAKRRVADHPADPLLPLDVAVRLAETRQASLPTVLRWVNRSLFLFPNGGEAHLLAARLFAATGRADQSALEYRLTLEAQPWRLSTVAREVAAHFKTADLLLRAMPETREAHGILGDSLLRAQGPELARAAMEKALENDPDDTDARTVLARACERTADLDCVEKQALALVQGDQPAIGHAMMAAVLARRGQEAQARAELKAGEAVGGGDVRFLHRAAGVYVALHDAENARRTVDRLWRMVALEDRAAAGALSLRAEVELRLGNPDQALKAYQQAYDRDAEPEYARRAAEVAKTLGKDDDARRILQKAGLDADVAPAAPPAPKP